MGTWETDIYEVGPCPCGKGHVERVVESPDNPWSKAHTSYQLACADCPSSWDMSSGGTLTERASEDEYRAASAASSKAAADLQDYLNSLLASFTFPTFKRRIDEFAFLSEQGLYRGSVGQYQYARRTREMRDIAEVFAGSPIVLSLVEMHGDVAQYQAMVEAAKAASEVAEAKSKAVKRMHFS